MATVPARPVRPGIDVEQHEPAAVAAAPARERVPVVVAHQRDLAECESDEHSDRKQGNEPIGLSVDDDEQQRRRRSER